jgi:hypothetical protein
MKKIEIPELQDCMTENIENKLLKTTEDGFLMYELLKNTAYWKENYNIIFDKSYETEENFFWIKELRGVKFSSREEAELYAFLDYCERKGDIIFRKTANRG